MIMLNNKSQMYLKLLQKEQPKIGNKIANKITKKSPQNTSETVESETKIRKEKYMSPEKRKQIIDELRLI